MSTNWRIGPMTKFKYLYQSWADEALCAKTDPELFFPEKGRSAGPAKAICRKCPVIQECLNYALTAPISIAGVWGGTDEDDRRELRRATPKRDDFPHGTEAGAQRHRRRGEEPCLACREGAAYQSRLRKARSA